MCKSNINDVANYLILENKIGITHRELQKILYFSQGFYLAEYGEPLFDSPMDAWKFGPVNNSIWGRFRSFGYHNLHVDKGVSTTTLTNNKKQFLSAILASFLVLGESLLIDMSHTDFPWKRNYIEGINKPIELTLIEEYFKNFDDYEQYIEIAKEKVEFSKLLTNRIQYLSSLHEVGSDWISGRSVAPTEDICVACSQFIKTFERSLFSTHATPKIPKILMGPIPTGGVGIELYLENKNLYLHFHNNEMVEVSIESNEKFDEYDISIGEFSEEISVFLEGVA